MNRRNLLSALAGLPFLGWVAPVQAANVGLHITPGQRRIAGAWSDGVAFNSMAHPCLEYLPCRLHEDDIMGIIEIDIELPYLTMSYHG